MVFPFYVSVRRPAALPGLELEEPLCNIVNHAHHMEVDASNVAEDPPS